MKVTLVGIGMGNPNNLTVKGLRALERASVIVGAGRMLSALPETCTQNRVSLIRAEEIAGYLKTCGLPDACVAFSGDTGFYSGAFTLRPLLESFCEVETLCGITTVQYLSSRCGIPWQDAHLVSAHGRACDPVAELLGHPSCFFLTDGQMTPKKICTLLCEAGLGETRVIVGERLSYPEERVWDGTAQELSGREYASLSAVWAFVGENLSASRCAHGLPDECFIRGGTPMTKQEVRSVVLSKLGIGERDTLWDVGAGTGSVSVEMALLARRGRVYAVERDEEALSLIRQNKEKFSLPNLTVVEGSAPQALQELPAPDAVFLGGTGGSMEVSLALAAEKNPRVRVAATAIVLQNAVRAVEGMRSLGFQKVELIQLSVSRNRETSSGDMMIAQNPIYLITGQGGGMS